MKQTSGGRIPLPNNERNVQQTISHPISNSKHSLHTSNSPGLEVQHDQLQHSQPSLSNARYQLETNLRRHSSHNDDSETDDSSDNSGDSTDNSDKDRDHLRDYYDDELRVDGEADPASSHSSCKRARGNSKMDDKWGNSNKKLRIMLNRYNQPIREGSETLASRLGNLARNGNDFSLLINDWRSMPIENKEKAWKDIKVPDASSAHRLASNNDIELQHMSLNKLKLKNNSSDKSHEIHQDVLQKKKQNDTTMSKMLVQMKTKKQIQYCAPEVEDYVELLDYKGPKQVLARGILISKNRSKMVGGKELGNECWEVLVKEALKPNENLLRPYEGVNNIGEAVRKTIAWRFFDVSKIRK